MAAVAISYFKNFNFWSKSGSISDVYQISLKSEDFSQRYGDLTIFKMAQARHLLKICIFCFVALVNMPFCFLIQNFAEIGQSVDE